MKAKINRPRGSDGAVKKRTRATSISNQHYRRSDCEKAIYVGNRLVGWVSDGIFRKRLRASEHFLRKPEAIAFDVSSLQDAEAQGARIVSVTDVETGTEYEAFISTIWADGFSVNRGHGKQRALRISLWRRPGDLGAEQLALFGGRHD